MNAVNPAGILVAAMMASATLPAVAEESDQQFANHCIPYGHTGSAIPDRATVVPFSQFRQLVSSGAAKLYSAKEVQSEQQAQAAIDNANTKLISDYLTLHPQLTNLQQIVANEPKSGGRAQPLDDGSWQVAVSGLSHPVVMPGRSSKLADIAYSIKTASDPVAQLALYSSLYNALPAAIFNTPAIALPPAPTQLATATLADIKGALTNLNLTWQTAIKLFHPLQDGVGISVCDRETGVGPDSSVYGDRSSNALACGAPSADGIFANFVFNGRGDLTCVKEQGNRGSCYAFAAVSAMEQSIARTYHVKTNLSEQDVIANYRTKWNPRLFGEGGSSIEVLNGAREHNYFFAFENQWPWNPSWNRRIKTLLFNGQLPTKFYTNSCDNYPSGETCSDTEPQGTEICTSAFGNLYCAVVAPLQPASSPYAVPADSTALWDPNDVRKSLDTVISSLAAGQSVVFGIAPTPHFMDLKAPGFLNVFAGTRGNVLDSILDLLASGTLEAHVVHVVGYIPNDQLAATLPNAAPAAGGGYFIIKNSWGTCWGDAGYGYLAADYLGAIATGALSLSDH